MCGRYYVDNEEENIKVRAILKELNRRRLPMFDQVRIGEIFPSQIAPVIVKRTGLRGDRPADEVGLSAYRRRGNGDQQPLREGRRDPDVPERPRGSAAALFPRVTFLSGVATAGRKTKDKFAFRPDTDEPLMYMAGFYGQFLGGFADGGYDGFAILTRAADEQMSPYHDRMPVILTDESLKKAWLNHDIAYADLRQAFDPPTLEGVGAGARSKAAGLTHKCRIAAHSAGGRVVLHTKRLTNQATFATMRIIPDLDRTGASLTGIIYLHCILIFMDIGRHTAWGKSP